MDRNRKILISILALLALSAIIAIIDVSLKIQKSGNNISLRMPSVGPGIAVVRVDGPIQFESSGPLAKGAESIINKLDEFSKNPNVKAIVLRINSPGGTVAATQEIYEKLWSLRKKNKILVASMADVAASGGYYIASACDTIYANYGTITGSIGVITVSANFKKLLERFGITVTVVKSGKYKDIMSPYRNSNRDEIRMIQEMIDSDYKKFLKDVARGRSMNQKEIEPYADGRIFNGAQAKKYKLIDSVGTFKDAIEFARKKAKLPEGCPVYEKNETSFGEFLRSIPGMFKNQNKLPVNLNYRTGLEYRYM